MAGGAGHHVEGAWFRVEHETFPAVADLAAETEFAGRGEREPEHLIEVLFVAVPADAGADIILRAKRMLDAAEGKAAKRSTRPASGTSQAGSSSAASSRWCVKS